MTPRKDYMGEPIAEPDHPWAKTEQPAPTNPPPPNARPNHDDGIGAAPPRKAVEPPPASGESLRKAIARMRSRKPLWEREDLTHPNDFERQRIAARVAIEAVRGGYDPVEEVNFALRALEFERAAPEERGDRG